MNVIMIRNHILYPCIDCDGDLLESNQQLFAPDCHGQIDLYSDASECPCKIRLYPTQ